MTAASRSRQVLVCGSRDWTDEEPLFTKLCELDPLSWEVMHGGAIGADMLAHRACLELGIPVREFLPSRDLPSPMRYHERNDAMLAKADRVIAFWDGESRGTKSVIDKARKRGIEVEVVHA